MNKINVEKSLYQPNVFGYRLVLLGIALNGYYIIETLNVVEKTYNIGGLVLFNIFISLLLFLSAVRCKVYSRNWAIGAIVVGVFQLIRAIVWIPEEVMDTLRTNLTIVLALSGIVIIYAGIISLIKTLNQITYKKDNTFKSGKLQ